MATVYAVASAKGGVGKTTTAANLAVALASAGTDVVAVDADIGMANLAGNLGVDVDDPTLHDALAGEVEPEATIQEGPAGLRVIPGETELDAYADADPAGLADVVAAVDDADYVILDCGAGLSHDSALPIGLADETLLVSTAERDALIDTEKTRQLTDRLGGDVAGAAITRVGPDDDVDALVDELLAAPVLGRIPEDEAVAGAVAAGEPVCTFAPHSNAAAAYRALAATLTGVDVPEPDLADAAVEEPEAAAGEEADEADEAEAADAGEADVGVAEAVGSVGSENGAVEAEAAETEAGEQESVEAEAAEAAEAADADVGEAEAATAEPVTEAEAPDEGTETEAEAGADAAVEASDEADEEPEAGADADAAETGAERTIPEAEPDRDEDVDDELAGSVPFQDSDREVPGSESPVADDDNPIAEAEQAIEAEAEEEEAEGDENGGFFSRLFGR
ncbi:nucleotide-binding protein [Haloparvum sp. AD34]